MGPWALDGLLETVARKPSFVNLLPSSIPHRQLFVSYLSIDCSSSKVSEYWQTILRWTMQWSLVRIAELVDFSISEDKVRLIVCPDTHCRIQQGITIFRYMAIAFTGAAGP
jgi:hypothetical protein